jgi:uncharacterized membrane protein YdjX (TVP38/TMEM64 family)
MTRRRVFLVLAGLCVVAALLFLPWRWDLPTIEPETVAERVRAAGPLGPVALLGWFVIQCVVAPLPSEPAMMAAGFVYGFGLAFGITWLGVVLGAAACFGLARRLGRPFVERFVRAERLEALDARVAGQGLAATFAVVLTLRLFTFTSFDVLSYGCGLLAFPFRWFLLATTLGAVPKVVAFTYAGAGVGERPGWLDGVILAGSLSGLLALPWLVRLGRRAAGAGKNDVDLGSV